MKDGILPSPPNNLGSCVECPKRKLTETRRRGFIRSQNLLEIILIDFCGPFSNPTLEGIKSFISFVDDF